MGICANHLAGGCRWGDKVSGKEFSAAYAVWSAQTGFNSQLHMEIREQSSLVLDEAIGKDLKPAEDWK